MKPSLIIAGVTGRMGSLIRRVATEQGFPVIGVLDRAEALCAVPGDIPKHSDPSALMDLVGPGVIVDFTAPAATMANVRAAVAHRASVVIGTTGLDEDQRREVEEAARLVPVFMSPNMSLGVNALLAVLPRLAAALGDGYDVEIAEVHHRHKKDAPSGTALRLGECLASARNADPGAVMRCSREGIVGERPAGEIGIQAVRGGDVAGIHTVYFLGEGERIEVTHHAHSRENFARGALRAAEWLAGRPAGRLYAMQDVLA